MSRSRLRLAASEDGATLIELMVVILIIGILAATGLTAFLHQRTKAADTEAKAAAGTAATALLVYGADHNGYTGATPADLIEIEISLGEASGLTVTADRTSFGVSVASKAGDTGGGRFAIERSDAGVLVRTCENAGQGGCAASPDALGNSW